MNRARRQALRSIVDRLFSLLARALKPYVEERFRAAYGEEWAHKAEIVSRTGDETLNSLDDPNHLLNLVKDHVDGALGQGLEVAHRQEARRLASRLGQERHAYAHFRPIEGDEVRGIAADARRLLAILGLLTSDLTAELDADEREVQRIVAGDPPPHLEELRREYVEERILTETTFVEPGEVGAAGVSGPVGVRLLDVYSPARFESVTEDWGPWRTRPFGSRQPTVHSGEASPSLGPDELGNLGRRCIVVLGEPGSGKTTLLRYLARTTAVGAGPFGSRTPILLRASDFAARVRIEPGLSLRRYLASRLSDRYGELYESELEREQALVLIDGLDEIAADGDRRAVVDAIQGFAGDHPRTPLVATSRPVGYLRGSLGPRFVELRLMPLSEKQIEESVRRWLQALGGSDDASEAEALIRAIKGVPATLELAASPLLLTIIVRLWLHGARLPDRRVEVYERATELLLRDRPAARPGPRADAQELYRLLEPVALDMITNGVDVIPEAELRRALVHAISEEEGLDPAASRRRAREILAILAAQTGLFVEQGRVADGPVYGFLHRAFTEYLAARALAQRWESGSLDLEEYLHKAQWREVIRLVFGHLYSRGIEPAEQAVRELLALEWPAERHLLANLRLVLDLLATEGMVLSPD